MPIDSENKAVDLSRAAKKWQALGDEKIVIGRNPHESNALRRLSSLLDAVGPYRKAQALWSAAARGLRRVGGQDERSASVADQHAETCARQVAFCGETFHEIVMQWAYDKEKAWTHVHTRIAAFEYERHANRAPLDELIQEFIADPVLRHRSTWGDEENVWWVETEVARPVE